MNWADTFSALTLISGASLVSVALARRYRLSVAPLISLPFILALTGVTFHFPLSPFFIPSDGEYYSAWGAALAADWRGGKLDFEGVLPGKGAIALIIAVFELLLGEHRLTIIALGSVTTTFVFLVLQICAEKIAPGVGGPWSSLAIFLAGGATLFFGPAVLRESYFWLGASLGTLAIVELWEHRIGRAFQALGASAFLLLLFRPDFGLLIVIACNATALTLIAARAYRARNLAKAVLSSLLAVIVVGSAQSAYELLKPLPTPAQIYEISDRLSEADVGSSFPREPAPDFCYATTATTATCQIVANVFHVVFGPYVWQVPQNPSLGLYLFSTLHSLGTLLLAFVFWQRNRAFRPLSSALAVLTTVSILGVSVVLTNFGIVWRLKAVALMFLYPLAFVGWRQLRPRLGLATKAPA